MTARPPSDKPGISREELALWRDVIKHDRKLQPSNTVEPPEPLKICVPDRPVPLPVPSASKSAALAALSIGDVSGLDKANATRLTRGRMPIDCAIDLHGMTRLEAQDALTGAIARAYRQELRCLLVITGKGARIHDESGEAGGVLKRLLPVWINLPEFRPYVLAVVKAQVRHGGDGAYYVLLKRRRNHA